MTCVSPAVGFDAIEFCGFDKAVNHSRWLTMMEAATKPGVTNHIIPNPIKEKSCRPSKSCRERLIRSKPLTSNAATSLKQSTKDGANTHIATLGKSYC